MAAARLGHTGTCFSCGRSIGLKLLRFGRERRQTSIRRVHDERSLLRRFAAFVPVIPRTYADAIATAVWIFFASDKSAAPRNAWITIDEFRCIDFLLLFGEGHSLREFFIRQKRPSSETAVALEWCADHVLAGPQSLNVRVAPRRLRRTPWLCCLRIDGERNERNYNGEQQNDETQRCFHPRPP